MYEVPCNYNTPSCECPIFNNDGEFVDVCSLSLVISLQHTFYRYEIDSDTGLQGNRAQVYGINELGEEMANGCSGCGSADCTGAGCTEAYMVDGYTYRTYIAVNNRIPGPTIIVNYNQTLMINVTNTLFSDDISIHWHGLHQVGTNWMDGVQHITQCGIPPSTSFTYIFHPDPPGTYWYHSHTGAQRTDGLFGPLIIRDPPDVVDAIENVAGPFQDIPSQHTLIFSDWQLLASIDISVEFAPGPQLTLIDRVPPLQGFSGYTPTLGVDASDIGPVPYFSGLINGKGRHVKVGQYDETVNYTQSRLSVFAVSNDETYRFRMIGGQGLFAFLVSIDEHTLTVIATDGMPVQPVEVQYIIIHAGERYDFLLNTKSADETSSTSNFMIRAVTLEADQQAGRLLTMQHFAEAILHYGSPDDEIPSTMYESIESNSTPFSQTCNDTNRCLVLNCPFLAFPQAQNLDCFHINNLELLVPPPEEDLPDIQVDPDANVFVNFGFEGVAESPSINARTNTLPSEALALLDASQLSVLQEAEFCKGLDEDRMCSNASKSVVNSDCACVHAIEIPFNKSIQFVISAVAPDPTMTGLVDASHPVHLHGHHFHVVDMQFGNYSDGKLIATNDDINCGSSDSCNNPSWKPGRGYGNQGQTGKIPRTAPLKDTIIVPAGGYVVVYITSDNPGYWFMHCHIEIHQLQGMATVIAEAIDELGTPPGGLATCGNFTWTVEEFMAFLDDSGGNGGGDGGGSLLVPSLVAIALGILISLLM